MADQPPGTQIVGLMMVVSAVSLVVLAVLIYAGTVPLPPEVRFIASLAVGAAAFLDFLVGVWFFRKGQSS